MRKCRAWAKAEGYRVAAEFSDAAVSARTRIAPSCSDCSPTPGVGRSVGSSWTIQPALPRSRRHLADRVEDPACVGIRSSREHRDGVRLGGARLTFGAMVLGNDTFLQLVKKEAPTAGSGTGLAGVRHGRQGRHGYTSVAEENPPDAEHPRCVPVVEPTEAVLVVLNFQMFVDGRSCQQIAYALNGEGISAPHDGGKGNKQGHGWGH